MLELRCLYTSIAVHFGPHLRRVGRFFILLEQHNRLKRSNHFGLGFLPTKLVRLAETRAETNGTFVRCDSQLLTAIERMSQEEEEEKKTFPIRHHRKCEDICNNA